MNEIRNKIRGYKKRQPITDYRLKFSNDLIIKAEYVVVDLVQNIFQIDHKQVMLLAIYQIISSNL